jgi:hypothetical protein
MRHLSLIAVLLVLPTARGEIVIAEGEKFVPADAKGWQVTHQNDSYGSHTYGGMWMTHGACLGAPADSVDAVATQTVQVPTAGAYRVWSKYQAPPYFNYLHRLEVLQQGRVVFSHVFGHTRVNGRKETNRLWSFGAEGDELWWPWGVDHDCAQPAPDTAELAAGPAELRLTAVKNLRPAGDRFIDFIVLTTNPENTYEGFKPYTVGSPFAMEALAATKLFVRVKPAGDKAAPVSVSRTGHFQPQYGGATTRLKAAPANEWSAWEDIGPFCRLVHDEGLTFTSGTGKPFAVQFARDPGGTDVVGDFTLADGEAAVVPVEITWKKEARVKPAREHAAEIIAASKTWRKANGGKKPKEVLFYGAFSGAEPWVTDLKDALGFNTLLPDKYDHVRRDGLHAHAGSPDAIRAFARTLKDKDRLNVLSFGDEIGLGKIDYTDPKNVAKFRDWLTEKKLSKAELGVEPAAATLGDAPPRLAWYSNLFNEEERFAAYRAMTELAKKEIGPHVLTGANYSPHHLALYYGPVHQWVDVFKHQGMSMFWAEDYIFSVPEVPQIVSWQFAQIRCGTKYHKQPIHFYVMPHAPGQDPGYLRRNTLFAVGNGTRHVDHFWIAPAERFTENYVGWGYRDTFRTLAEGISDTATAETFQVGGTVRPARVALVTGKATDFNESRALSDKTADPFARRAGNAPTRLTPTTCRKEQQMLYLALRQAQHAVDLITEDDIVELDALKGYDVVYFAGLWIDHRAVPKLDAWVRAGGVLYAATGSGMRNEFNEPEPAMLDLLGLKDIQPRNDAVVIRTLLELPLLTTDHALNFAGGRVPAVGLQAGLVPTTAKVLATWRDDFPAVTVNEVGKGKAFAVGLQPGTSWMKTGLRVIPYARGGRHSLYNPSGFDETATALVRLGLSNNPVRECVCSLEGVEATVLDNPKGTLVTLTNWTDKPATVTVQLRSAFAPRSVRSVQGQKALDAKYADGVATFSTTVADADYILVEK